jgi:hypothetical protein
MTLIEQFENKPVQDVGTFNSIFKTTPLIGFKSNLPVYIGRMTPMGRELRIGEETLVLELPASIKLVPRKEKRVSEIARVSRKNRRRYEQKNNFDGKLPRVMKELTFAEYFAYRCLKHMKTATAAEICREVSITENYRTMLNHLNALVEKGYAVKTPKRNYFIFSLTQREI